MNIPLPENTKRIVLVSNIANPPAFTFADTDLIIECNHARHHSQLMELFKDGKVNNFLVIRHNKNGHFLPKDFDKVSHTWAFIYLTSDRFGFSQEKWFKSYFNSTEHKTPTTGFALYKYFRSRRPNIPIIGLGFNIDDHSTPHAKMHDWEYEYKEYAKDKNFKAIK